MKHVYAFFGGFGEFVIVLALGAAIALAFMGRLSGTFVGTLASLQGFAVIHDQLTTYQNGKNG